MIYTDIVNKDLSCVVIKDRKNSLNALEWEMMHDFVNHFTIIFSHYPYMTKKRRDYFVAIALAISLHLHP